MHTQGPAKLSVFSLQGRLVRDFVLPARAFGPVSIAWNGRDNLGRELSSGVYLVRLRQDCHTVRKRITLVR
jgi:hypothetical protein